MDYMTAKQFLYKNTCISYSDTGKGNAVFLLHGFLENKTIWNSIIKSLALRYRVIAVDLLGHGLSDCLGYLHTMEDQADMVFGLVSHLKLRKISFIGHSMGGYVALAFAELYPDYVRHLVLLNSSSRADSDEKKHNRDRAIQVVKKNSSGFIKIAIVNLFSAKAQQKFKQEILELTNASLQTSLQGIVASLEGMKIRQDREVLLHFGPYPKLMIAGREDRIIPLDEIQDQIQGTDTKLHVLDCGHMAWLEEEELCVELLIDFLKR